MHRNKSVNVHQFAMVPRAEIPRSQFLRQSTHKTTFDAGYLVPIYLDEVLPGDTFNFKATLFARMATPIFPIMDNLHLDTFFFFVPNRLVWTNWVKMMGQQDDPGDSIAYSVPQMNCPEGGYAVGSLHDYMGLPTYGQVHVNGSYHHSALFHRAYNLIWNEWFRDENLQDSVVVDKDDSDSDYNDYVLLKRGKRHDYFTSCLPWVQKGTPISLPLGTTADVVTMATEHTTSGTGYGIRFRDTVTGNQAPDHIIGLGGGNGAIGYSNTTSSAVTDLMYPTNLYADLTNATAATINQLRQSFQIQKLLERDARGGTRYTEIVRAHFGVQSPDARLQRPEYLGGGSSYVNINPVAQTSETNNTPQGNLSAFATSLAGGHGFSASFTEHGMIIGLVSVRADLTYQQGLQRMWSRETRYDFYFPAFAMLGEQAVLNKEIYCRGTADDENVFGYNERWAELRYKPSQITGLFRSTSAGTIDGWHLAQNFGSLPALDDTFIQENPPMSRVLAVGAGANGQHFILDAFFDNKVARPMPMYSVPGLIDHF